MRFPDVTIDGVGAFITQINSQVQNANLPMWFRGQSKSEWQLVPKILRADAGEHSESFLIRRFKQNASLLLQQRPQNDFEWMFLMQHHSMPTRLLDWSESPLVALYFAVEANHGDEGALWTLLPTALNERSNYRPDYALEIPSFEDEHLTNYLPETVASEHRSRLLPMAAIAPRNSTRMQSQQGAFTISHRDNIPINDAGAPGSDRDYVWRYLIPPSAKAIIKKELKILGVTRFQLFPDLDSLAQM